MLLALGGGSAEAQQPNGPDYAFGSPGGEVALTALSALSLAAFALPQRQGQWAPSSERPAHEGFEAASDFVGGGIGASWQLVGSYGLEVGYYEQHQVDDALGRAFRTSLIDLQAMALATGVTMVLKRVSGRCRPRAWHDGSCGPEPEHDAFPSGHVTPVSAVAGSHLLLALRSDGDPLRRQLAFGFAEAASVATALLRVLAGAHSWEDVVAGWAVGHASGALVSIAHPMVAIESAVFPGKAAPSGAAAIYTAPDGSSDPATAFATTFDLRFSGQF